MYSNPADGLALFWCYNSLPRPVSFSCQLFGPPTRPQPWSPIRPFALKRELSLHPDKAFVKELVNDLQHRCSIGYTGPQFAHLAKSLPTAYQQPDVIDATLQRECEAGRILGPFTSQPLPNFRTSRLALIPKHDGGWQII